MRIILKKPPRTNSEPLRKTLGWPTLKKRRHINMLGQVHRCLQGHAPQYLHSKFSTNAESGYKGTRGENKLHLQRPLIDNYGTFILADGSSILAWNFHYRMEWKWPLQTDIVIEWVSMVWTEIVTTLIDFIPTSKLIWTNSEGMLRLGESNALYDCHPGRPGIILKVRK